MYAQSSALDKIDSVLTIQLLSKSTPFNFSIHKKNLKGAVNELLILKRCYEKTYLDMVSFIYNDTELKIHLELENIVDNDLIVDLKNLQEISIENNVDNINMRLDDNNSYFQISFNEVEKFNKFFDFILWPHLLNIINFEF